MGDGGGGAGVQTPSTIVGGTVALAPQPLIRKGKAVARGSGGQVCPLVINIDAARKAINGFPVVGRLLSPYQVKLRIIIDELRSSTWWLQSVVTIQEVATQGWAFCPEHLHGGRLQVRAQCVTMALQERRCHLRRL